jgi:uroporphyrinogen decarboxylase
MNAFANLESIREKFHLRFGQPQQATMNPYERVKTAIDHGTPDRTPFDFWAVPETIGKLLAALGVRSEEELYQLLGIDCRIVKPDYIGPEPEKLADGTFYTPWGNHRKLVQNDFSTYEEYASFPLARAATVAEVETWPRWPKSEYWDWAGVPAKVAAYNGTIRYHIRYDIGGIFESAWGIYGLDRFLMDLIDRPEIPCAIMDCYTDLMINNVKSLMKAASGLIDIVYTYDDVAVQNGLMMSPAMWRKYILPCHQRLNKVIKSFDLKILYHSCGAIYPLIRALIDDMGIDVLNPLQPRAAMMDMQRIKQEFGGELAFHGGIDLQVTMARGQPADVEAEVADRIRVLAAGGGYICTTAHYIQADTPLENIFALYLANRNGV